MPEFINQGVFDWEREVRALLVSRRAESRSPQTLRFCEGNLALFKAWLSETYPNLGPFDVRAEVVREFPSWLLSEPVRWGGLPRPANPLRPTEPTATTGF